MFYAGQNVGFGTVEEAVAFWTELPVDHIMIKSTPDLPLVEPDGGIREEDFRRLEEMGGEHSVAFHLHPFDLEVGGIPLATLTDRARVIWIKILKELDRMVQRYGLYPLITIHMARFSGSGDEEEALGRSVKLIDGLDLRSDLALETLFSRNGIGLIGHRASHFVEAIGDRDIGLCIDTGHNNLNGGGLRELLDLPYRVMSMHLHGNDGSRDSHDIPTYRNVAEPDLVKEALRRCEGPVVIEVRDGILDREGMEECLDLWGSRQ